MDLITNEAIKVPVKNRTAETLLPLIQRFILLLCQTYAGINNLLQVYFCLTVNNTVNFVDPATGATTNHIESTQQKTKQKHKEALIGSC